MKPHHLVVIVVCMANVSASFAMDHSMHTREHQVHVDSMHSGQSHHRDHMHGMYGNYPMTREASGTSWVPDSSPQEGFHKLRHDWMLMFLGYSYTVADVQRGKRGGHKIFDANMFMFMAQKDYGKSTIAFRSMVSIEPLTIGCAYPLLLQTGETCDGVTPLIDRQHAHDMFMELAGVYSYRFNDVASFFFYAGLPGEPAVGPPVYIMRFSSEYIPETPLGHHWMDSTHITFGVLTAGLVYKGAKIEFSAFKGREPNQFRFDIEKPKIDSYACRLSLNPTDDWALQTSYAFLKSSEQIHPNVNTHRFVTSALYNKQWCDNNFQGAAILGVNVDRPGLTLPAFLLEGTLALHNQHMFFSRFEIVEKEGLFLEPDPRAEQTFGVSKLTVGYIYEFLTIEHTKWGIGTLLDFPMVPQSLKSVYGKTFSYMFFLQVKLI